MKIDDIEVNYKKEGDGKTLIFIHGLSDTLNYWNVLTSDLKNYFNVISYDLRGHGKTTPGNKKITMDLLVNDLNELIKSLKISNVCLIGLSLGGHLALKYALTYPENVSSLIIMSSSYETDDKLFKRFNEFYEALNIGFEEFYDVIIKYVLPDDLLMKYEDKLKIAKKQASEISNVDAIKQYIEMGKYYNISQKVENIDVPTLILSGRDDDITDVVLQEQLHKKIKNSEMINFKNTRHNILIGRNISKILDIIKNFIMKTD